MFKFLKDKLKAAVKKVSNAFEGEEEQIKAPKPEDFKAEKLIETRAEIKAVEKPKAEKKHIEPLEKPKEQEQKAAEKPAKKEEMQEKRRPSEEAKEQKPAEIVHKPKAAEPKAEITVPKAEIKEFRPEPVHEEKKGFFAKLKQAVSTTKISESKFDELFWDMEVAMLESNVAFEAIEKIKQDLKQSLVDVPISRGNIEDAILDSLRKSIDELLSFGSIDIVREAKEKKEKPYVIAFLGANGSGKTTTIAKFAKYLASKGLKSCLAAADTWRSAAIQQLEMHANALKIPIVKHDYGADPAAVSFDCIKMAQARKLDVVLIDTAGRQHSNTNLVDEMKKIVRIAKPDLKIYIGEMIAGNDCIEQIKSFDEAVSIDGVILTKADIDEKGGTAISVSHVTKKPILFLGTGQDYDSLEEFDKEKIIKNLGL